MVGWGRKQKLQPVRPPLGSDDSVADKANDVDENHDGFLMVVYAGGDVQKVEATDIKEGRDLPGNLVAQEGGE